MINMAIPNPVMAAAEKAADKKGTDKFFQAPSGKAESAPATEEEDNADTFNDIRKLIGKNRALATANSEAATANMGVSAGLTDTIMKSMDSATKAAQTIALVTDTAKLEASNATRDAYTAAAGDAKFQQDIMARLSEDEGRVETLLNQNAEIMATEYTGVQFLDNIVNQFNVNLNAGSLRNASNQLNQTKGEIASVTGATDSFAKINMQVAKSVTNESIRANQELIASNAEIGKAKAALDGLNTADTAMTNLLNAGQREVANLMGLARLEDQELNRAAAAENREFTRKSQLLELERYKDGAESRTINLEVNKLNLKYAQDVAPYKAEAYIAELTEKKRQLALDKEMEPTRRKALMVQYTTAIENAPINKEQAQLRLAASKKQVADADALEVSYVTAANAAEATAGLPISSAQEVMAGMASSGPLGTKYQNLILSGGSGDINFASNPFDSATYLSKVDPKSVATQNTGTDLLNTITQAQAAKYIEAGNGVPRDEATQKVDYNNTAQEIMNNFAANIVTNDTTNPYSLPPMSVLTQSRAVRESAFYKKVIQATQKTEFDPQFFLDEGVAAINAGVVSTEEVASGIVAMVNAGQLYNNTTSGGFKRVGLRDQVSYNTVIKRPVGFIANLPTSSLLANTAVVTDSLFGGIISSTEAGKSFLADSNSKRNTKVDLDKYGEVLQILVKNLSSTPKKESTD